MVGVVFCGGESKRMGKDKGLLPGEDKTWAQHAESKLSAIGLSTKVSINKAQLMEYKNIFPVEKLVIDKTVAKGPLNGLLSVHQKCPDQDLLILACDMTDINTDILKALEMGMQNAPSFDYYLYESNGFMEPLCAIYTSQILNQLLKKLNSGNLSSFTLHKLIKQSKHKTFKIENIAMFSNYNSYDTLCSGKSGHSEVRLINPS